MFSPQFLFFLLLTSFNFITILPLLILKIFNLQVYKITDNSEFNKLINRLNIKNSTIICNEKPEGFIYGKWYLGFIYSNKFSQKTLYILLKKNIYKKINETTITSKNNKNIKKIVTIDTYSRLGNYSYLYYNKRKLDVTNFNPYPKQNKIINKVINEYKKNQNYVFYLYGKPGSGKSTIGYLLTKELKGSFCDTWNPTEPSDSLDLIYNNVLPSEQNPLILVLEEFDKIIDLISNQIPLHKNIPIYVRNKTSWNSLLDKIQLGIYPYLILILNSNKGPEYINNIDNSYIRKGRVNKIFKLD